MRNRTAASGRTDDSTRKITRLTARIRTVGRTVLHELSIQSRETAVLQKAGSTAAIPFSVVNETETSRTWISVAARIFGRYPIDEELLNADD